MKELVRSRRFWICALVFVPLLLLVINQALKVADLIAVQNTVRRDWEVNYGFYTGPEKPACLPAFIDSAAQGYCERVFAGTRGSDGTGMHPPHTRNRDIVYQARFQAFFRGPIREISVYDFEGFDGDLGAALLRMSSLRRVELYSTEGTESEWALVCTRLRALPHLEELEIGGRQLTDGAIAPLAGHPRLRRLIINEGPLTVASTRTFTSLPHLNYLVLGEIFTELSPEEKAAMSAALPKVQITFP
jgi:hypothetical protein